MLSVSALFIVNQFFIVPLPFGKDQVQLVISCLSPVGELSTSTPAVMKVSTLNIFHPGHSTTNKKQKKKHFHSDCTGQRKL